MVFFYNLFIRLFGLFARIYSHFNNKAKLWVNGRKDSIGILSEISKDTSPKIWFHCASLGEFEQARPLIEEFKKSQNTKKIVITFFSPSGYEIRKNYSLADYVLYLPEDTPKNALNFIEIIKPEKALFIKYDFWYNYLFYLTNKNIPTYFISSRFYSNHFIFSFLGKSLYKGLLNRVNCFFVQEEFSLKLLRENGYSNAIVSGDTRFDKVMQTALEKSGFLDIETWIKNQRVILFGSSWENEEKIAADFYKKHSDWKVIIAPHDVSEKHLKEIEKVFSSDLILYSNIGNAKETNVLLIDNVGMLSQLYQYADIAFVGGGFSGKLHNVLEPLAFKIPVICGKNISKFWEAEEAKKLGILYTVNSIDELNLESLLRIDKKSIEKFVQKYTGATKKIIAYINAQ